MRFIIAITLSLIAFAASAAAVTFHRGNLAEPDTLDPQRWFTTYEAEILRDLFSGLLQMNERAEAIPGAAESWTVSDDGLTLTFTLRADGKWSDGAPVVAADFVLGLKRAFDPKLASPYANFGYVIVNARAVTAGEMPPEALGVRAIDARTLEIKLERPSQTILWLLGAFPVFFPTPSHLYERVGADWVKPGVMVSNGAFALKTWVPNGEIRLSKNPHFYDAGEVTLDEVVFYPTDDDAAAVKRFRAGELDVNLRFPPGQYEMLKRDLPDATRVNPASWVGYIVFNHHDPRFADKRVRRALSLAIDREAIASRVLNNGELPAWSIVPPMAKDFVSSGAGDFSNMPMEERRAEAKRLLAEAGFGDGNALSFAFQHRIGEANKRAALAVRDMWKAVGVDARLEANEVKVHYARLREQQFEVADGGWSAPPDAEYFLYLIRSDSKEMNFGGWSNAEFDRLSDLGNRELDPVQRGRYYAEADRIATDETAIVPVYIPVERSLVQPWVKGYELNAVNYHPSRWIRLER